MTMILDWQQLTRYFGDEIRQYRDRFEEASDTTHALLCCRLAPSNTRVAASGGKHAEQKLLASPIWTNEIPAALDTRMPGSRSQLLVALVINRTPCRACTQHLIEALEVLQWRFAARFPEAQFILACRGAYRGKVTDAGYYENATTVGDLIRLTYVGWKPCVLRVQDLAPSGQELLQALKALPTDPERLASLNDTFDRRRARLGRGPN